jgi:RNA polymerase sigma-70 factor (ECF subfamily)
MVQNAAVAGASDPDLVERFLAGRSEEAFRALYRAHTPYLFCLAMRLAGGREDEAEEAVQEAWIRAAERLESFRWGSALRTWLGGFVVNCCREAARRRRPAGPVAVPSEPVERPWSEESLDLERAVAALPDGLREVFVLFDLEGHTHEEIGERLGIVPGTSKSRLFHARRALRRLLADRRSARGGAP